MFDEENEDQKISSKPNAMVLFNPGVITASVEEYKLLTQGSKEIWR